MKTSNNQTGGGSSCGKLLSLFGRKLKTQVDSPVETGTEIPQVEPEITNAILGQARRILVADDDPVFSKATENKLKAHGFKVTTAFEGSEVIRAAREEAPDAILLDIDFPPELPTSWDGFTIMEWLNQMNWCPNTPVIICTGTGGPELEQRAKALRAAGVLHKPLDYSALLGLLEFKLTHRQFALKDDVSNN